MMNLIVAEIQRIFARRMTRYFPLGLMAVILLGVGIAGAVIVTGDGDGPDFVGDIGGGTEATEILGPITLLLAVMSFVVAASSIGADAKSGMLEQLLTWEPRRGRLLGARAIAVFVCTALLAIGVAAFMILSLFVLSAATGTTEGMTGEFIGNVVAVLVRTGLAGGFFGLLGLGITLAVNSSIGAIVGYIIYAVIVDNLLIFFLPWVHRFLPVINLDAVAAGRDVERLSASVLSGGDGDFVVSHSWQTAFLILVIWGVGAVGLAWAVFRRRDIDS